MCFLFQDLLILSSPRPRHADPDLADLLDHLPGQELLHGGQEHQAEEGSLGENYREGREGREL